MKLPNNSIGVTDILQYRDCARRFEFGMRRHTGNESPQANGPSNAYGSVFHDVVAYIREHNCPDEEAIQFGMTTDCARWISPDDLERMHLDLRTYRERDYHGVATIMSEQDLRVPLFKYQGEQYYYRFKVDRLYRSLRDPGSFIQVDYKTSKHMKTDAEVHSDPQMSAYAFGLREVFPEIERLVQVYDQLNFGAVPTSRSDEQIELIKEWLTTNAIAILEDDELKPTYNTFCAYCPVLLDCPIIPELTDYALGEISGLVPKEVDGKLVGPNGDILEGASLDPYVEMLEKVSRARKILEEFDGRVRGTIRELPIDERLRYGFQTKSPTVSSWPPAALEALSEILGTEFWQLINLPKNAVARLPKDQQELVNSLAVKHKGAPRMTKLKREVSNFDETPAEAE